MLSGVEERYIEPRTIQYRFKSILKSCNLKDIKFHALRHTFATRCIEGGCDIKCLSEMLGHSSVSITLNRYVHSSIDQKKSNGEKKELPYKFDYYKGVYSANGKITALGGVKE